MSSLIHSPKSGSTTAAKLKGFGHALNKSLGIAKRWTLEKVGAKEQSQGQCTLPHSKGDTVQLRCVRSCI